jgi:hypothetical protein
MTLNLAKVRPGALTPTDLFITVVMLDAQSIALSAVLSSKDALASRWYVLLTAVVQCFAWTVVLVASTRLEETSFFNAENPCCLRETWMSSYFHTCGTGIQLRTGFLTYWISHAYDTVQSLVLALLHTTMFDSLEKVDRKHQRDLETDPAHHHDDDHSTLYGRLPGTAFSNWQGFVLYPLLLIMTIEGHISRNAIPTPSSRDWGQTFAITACVCGVSHWLYVQRKNWRHYLLPHRSSSENPMRPVNEMRYFKTAANVLYEHVRCDEDDKGYIRLGEEDARLLMALREAGSTPVIKDNETD